MKETTAMKWSRGMVVRMVLVCLWAVSLLTLAFPASAQAQGGGGGVHVVEAGETLSQIARQYGTDVATLLALNGLGNANLVYVGQQLVVGGGGGPAAQGRDESSGRPNTNGGQGASGPYQRAGVGWQPEGEQRTPYREDPQWSARPREADAEEWNEAADAEWDGPRYQRPGPAQGERPSPYLEEWESVHSAQSYRNPGQSWEPEESTRPKREEALTGEKWIDIDISDQVLTAYQGDTVVRVFTISSGSSRYPTVTGTFYTYARVDLQDMSGGSQAAGDYYYQPDVPWVQYFFEGYAIHGAWWHNSFGTPIGHGCINMRVADSQWLYEWTAVAGIRVEVHQ
jgi:lipoprotein-anchoring transpeptidase ErfK/SrfK